MDARGPPAPGCSPSLAPVPQQASNRSHITAATAEGAVRLIDARIGGNLFCGHPMVRNSDGPGVLAHGLRTERDLFFEPEFTEGAARSARSA